MKKLILTAIGLVAGATFVHAQGGDISTYLLSADIQTSSSQYSTSNSYASAAGLTKTSGSSAYYYAVLAATSTSAADSAPGGPDWTPVTLSTGGNAIIANSIGSGGVAGNGNASGFSSSLTAGTTYDIIVAGWSASLGNSWSQVSAFFADGFDTYTGAAAFAGFSNIGTIDPTAAPAAAAPVFGGSGVQNGEMVLYSIPVTAVPEPATLALAGLGGLSMLFLRRRKS